MKNINTLSVLTVLLFFLCLASSYLMDVTHGGAASAYAIATFALGAAFTVGVAKIMAITEKNSKTK